MGVEGMTDLLPGALRKSPSSEGPQNYFRNVEAVGSNPITSTIHLVGSPRESPQRSDPVGFASAGPRCSGIRHRHHDGGAGGGVAGGLQRAKRWYPAKTHAAINAKCARREVEMKRMN